MFKQILSLYAEYGIVNAVRTLTTVRLSLVPLGTFFEASLALRFGHRTREDRAYGDDLFGVSAQSGVLDSVEISTTA